MEPENKEVSLDAAVEAVERLTPYISTLVSNLNDLKQPKPNIIMIRRQYFSYGVIILVVLSVSLLAYFGAIHGSAATGIFGAVVGYIFSNARNTQS